MILHDTLIRFTVIILILMLPIISVDSPNLSFQIKTYQFSFVLLMILFFFKSSIEFKTLKCYLILLLFMIIPSLFSIYEINFVTIISQKLQSSSTYHILKQLILQLVFISLLLVISGAKIKEKILISAIKSYIYMLLILAFLSIFLMFLEIAGYPILESSMNMDVYKLQGFLGEPKQFGAAMLSGFLLVKFSLINTSKVFSHKFKKYISMLFLIFGMATLSTSFFASLIILFLTFFLFKMISPKKIIYGFILLFLCILIIPIESKCIGVQKTTVKITHLNSGISSVYEKISSFDKITAYLPKDGLIIDDMICNKQKYIVGAGAGSLYKKIISNELAYNDKLKEIAIFRNILINDDHHKQGPSLYQFMFLTDYGFIGLFVLILLLQRAEKAISRGVNIKYGVVYFFIGFLVSLPYFMFLLLMHFFAIKISTRNLET
jgi:hypothetical protein